jgi:type IV pilus assembly protein PilV
MIKLSTRFRSFQGRRAQSGLTLIEILVSLLVLSIGLLGVAALQGFTLQANQGAYHRTQAVNTVYEVAEFMRTNRGNPAALDFTAWQTRIAQQFPAGVLTVNWNPPLATITLTWQEDRLADAPGAGETVTVVTNL